MTRVCSKNRWNVLGFGALQKSLYNIVIGPTNSNAITVEYYIYNGYYKLIRDQIWQTNTYLARAREPGSELCL